MILGVALGREREVLQRHTRDEKRKQDLRVLRDSLHVECKCSNRQRGRMVRGAEPAVVGGAQRIETRIAAVFRRRRVEDRDCLVGLSGRGRSRRCYRNRPQHESKHVKLQRKPERGDAAWASTHRPSWLATRTAVSRVSIETLTAYAAMCISIRATMNGQVTPGTEDIPRATLGANDRTSAPSAIQRYVYSGATATWPTIANTTTAPDASPAVTIAGSIELSNSENPERGLSNATAIT